MYINQMLGNEPAMHEAMSRPKPINGSKFIVIPYSAIFWQRKILADLANRTPFANILPRQIPDSLK